MVYTVLNGDKTKNFKSGANSEEKLISRFKLILNFNNFRSIFFELILLINLPTFDIFALFPRKYDQQILVHRMKLKFVDNTEFWN